MGEINKGKCAIVQLYTEIVGDIYHHTMHFMEKLYEGSAEDCLKYINEKNINLGNNYALVPNFNGIKEVIQKANFTALQNQPPTNYKSKTV